MNFMATSSELFDDVINYPEFVIGDLATKQSAANPAIKTVGGAAGGLLAVLELIGGVHGVSYGVNAWTTIQERRIRLMDQIGGDSGETATRLYNQSVFEQWLTDNIGEKGAVISFRQLINLINGYVFYDFVPNPVGRYVPGSNKIPKTAEKEKQRRLADALSSASGADIDLSTGLSSQHSLLKPGLQKKVEELLRIMVKEKGWDGKTMAVLPPPDPKLGITYTPEYTKGLACETSIRVTSTNGPEKATGAHATGNAVDVGGSFGTGYDSRDLLSASIDDKLEGPTAKSGWYAEMHRHLKKGQPIDPGRLKTSEILKLFMKDLKEAIARVKGLKWGGSWGTPFFDNHGVPCQWATYGDPKEHIFDYAWYSIGVGWDPVHVENIDEEPDTAEPVTAASLYATSLPFLLEKPAVKIEGVPIEATAPVEVVDNEPRERLITQVLRPDVWYVAPPACNILFPEEYASFSFNREMMLEVTRLELITAQALYDSAIVNQYYFAPKLKDTESLSTGSLYTEGSTTGGGIGSATKPIIYAHEKFTGVIPRHEKISEVSFYARLAGDQDLRIRKPAEEGGEAVPEISDPSHITASGDTLENQIEQYASSVASYMFLRYRYASRSGAINAKFMPRVVCGFPMLVVSRPVVVDDLTPLHFLGLVISVTHSLTQSGGNTAINLKYLRSHKKGGVTDDLFSELVSKTGTSFDVKERKTVIVLQDEMPDRALYLAKEARSLFNAEGRGRTVPAVAVLKVAGGGEQVKRTDAATVTPLALVLSAPGSGLAHPLPGIVGPNGGEVSSFDVAEEDLANLITITVGKTRYVFPFTKVTVVEDMSTAPIEEVIRPPWISEEYSNAEIGKLYTALFGCESLIDMRSDPAQRLSIETSTDMVVDEYSRHSQGGQQANSYIYGMTHREYATLPQVLNSFHENSFGVRRSGKPAVGSDPDFKSDLEGLDIVGQNLVSVNGNYESQQINEEEAAKLDPRPERGRRVLAYLQELLKSRGLRG
jgi:hypothetical protein